MDRMVRAGADSRDQLAPGEKTWTTSADGITGSRRSAAKSPGPKSRRLAQMLDLARAKRPCSSERCDADLPCSFSICIPPRSARTTARRWPPSFGSAARRAAVGRAALWCRAFSRGDHECTGRPLGHPEAGSTLHRPARCNRARGFALTAILVTALGVGANTAAFSVADFVLLRPLPFADPDALVRLCEGPRTGGGWGCMNELSPANYRDFKALSSSFEAMGAFTGSAVNLVGIGEPRRLATHG